MPISEFRQIEALAESSVSDDPEAFRLPSQVVREMVAGGVAPEEISRIIGIGPTDLTADRLTSGQSDRAVRLARVVALAERVFGSRDQAFVWLRLPSNQLEGRTPFAYLTTETGARFVEEMLIRIDHGIAA